MLIDCSSEICNCWALYTAPQNIKVLILIPVMASYIIFAEWIAEKCHFAEFVYILKPHGKTQLQQTTNYIKKSLEF